MLYITIPVISHPIILVQSLSHVRVFATPPMAARQTSLCFTISRSCSNSCSLSQRCHPTISFSVAPFSSSTYKYPNINDRALLCFNLWLVSLSILPSRFIQVLVTGRISFLLWLGKIQLCVYTTFSLSIHPWMDKHLDGFHVSAIVNNAAMSVEVQISLWDGVHFLWMYIRSGFAE